MANTFPKLKDIINFPLEEQAKFCDGITFKAVQNNQEWISEQLKEPINEDFFHVFNVTSLGNLARIAVSYKNEEAKNKAMVILNNYKKWFIKKI